MLTHTVVPQSVKPTFAAIGSVAKRPKLKPRIVMVVPEDAGAFAEMKAVIAGASYE
jgi:hypothetical protein